MARQFRSELSSLTDDRRTGSIDQNQRGRAFGFFHHVVEFALFGRVRLPQFGGDFRQAFQQHVQNRAFHSVNDVLREFTKAAPVSVASGERNSLSNKFFMQCLSLCRPLLPL